jgi:photosystem II stability/assembly factor-like uncharacterized protein
MKKDFSFKTLFLIACSIFLTFFDCQSLYSTTLDTFNLTDIISTPDGNLYLATEYGGLFRSTDDGTSWFLTNSITTKYNISTILWDDYEGLFLATKDGVFLQSTDKGVTWRIRTASEQYSGFAPINQMIKTNRKYKVYCTDGDIEMSLDNHNMGLYQTEYAYFQALHYSSDGTVYACGEHIYRNDSIDYINYNDWVDITKGLNLFSYSLASDNNNRIYDGTEKGVYFSDNKGDKWNLLSSDIQNYLITNICIGNNKILIGTDSSGIFKSSDSGKTFKPIIIPSMNSRINKIYKYQNSFFALTSKNGLYKSTNDGTNWTNVITNINNQADSVIAEGWMPCINFYDYLPKIGPITYLKYLDNDSIFTLRGGSNGFKIYNLSTLKILSEYWFPSSFSVMYYYIINLDSVLIISNTDKYHIGIFSFKTNEFKDFFSLDDNYFKKQIPQYSTFVGVDLYYSGLDFEKNSILLSYALHWCFPPQDITHRSSYHLDKIDINSGELAKTYGGNTNFSPDKKYYITENTKLYDRFDQLIYDIASIPENQNYLKNTFIASAQISPHNIYIVLLVNSNRFLVVDFQTGKILRSLYYSEYCNYYISNDDNYLFTSSNESAIKVYNLNNSSGIFDSVMFGSGYSDWGCTLAQNSNAILFAGSDYVLRLWKPNFTLTGVEEPKQETETENYLYPNPATDYINLPEIPEFNSDVNIYSIFGNKVFGSRAMDNRIDVSFLSPGLYFMKINDKVYKFLKL